MRDSSYEATCYYIETSASRRRFTVIRRAFDEFLALPTAIFVASIALALVTLYLDGAKAMALQDGKQLVMGVIFRTESSTHDFLATLLAGFLTLISITFSILLLAVQQTASSLSNQVYDQFLRRTANQIFLGYVVGLAVYTLIVLATVGKGFNPVYSASTVLVFTVVGFGLLIVLIYGTIYQMRPVVIIEAMHDHILRARARQRSLVERTRRDSHSKEKVRVEIRLQSSGFFQNLHIRHLEHVSGASGEIEILILHPIGTYLAEDDTIALIKAQSEEAAEEMVPRVTKALKVESARDLNCDPAWGIIELESVAWTTVSSAKSTPEPPRLVINALRDILTRWTKADATSDSAPSTILPIVYPDDVRRHVLNALATIAAGANESLQHVVMIEALNALRSLYIHVPETYRPEIKDVIRRVVPALRPLILTNELEQAIQALARCLSERGDQRTAQELTAAVEELAKLVGHLPQRAA